MIYMYKLHFSKKAPIDFNELCVYNNSYATMAQLVEQHTRNEWDIAKNE